VYVQRSSTCEVKRCSLVWAGMHLCRKRP
jgi:hypothetical protein